MRTQSEPCPWCGAQGTLTVAEQWFGGDDEDLPRADPVEFDCPNGCDLDSNELLRYFSRP